MYIIDSVAAVFCHAGEIFAVRRQSHLNAFPGYDSFPGGKIDKEDSSTQHPAPLLCALDGKRMHALIRETEEELGFDLPGAIASGQVTDVKYLATALAPALAPIRFCLHYYRIDLSFRPSFHLDQNEIAAGFWKTPQQVLDSFERGDSLMVPPMRQVLKGLVTNPQGNDFGDLSPNHDEENYVPLIEPLSGLRMLPVPANTFPPVKRTNAFLLGDPDAEQILVDPSPESPEVLEKLLRTLEPERISAIFLTHHHPDHHQHAPDLAKKSGVPIWLSEDTHTRITARHGTDYFSGLRIEFKREGDRLTRWKGEPVTLYEVPGHDAGQLAIAPDSLRWFIVGDLIQSFGTVVIAAPEGDMATYYQTLERVISLEPAVIVPSHGMPMRGTFRLKETLQHRRQRERQIKALYADGKSEPEILEIVYQGVPARLHPYALKNICAHLEKLRCEGQI